MEVWTSHAYAGSDLFYGIRKKINYRKYNLQLADFLSVCSQMLMYNLNLVLYDIINYNYSFEVATVGHKSYIRVESFDSDILEKVMQSGGLQGLDILETNFKGYNIFFVAQSNENVIKRTIYSNQQEYKDTFIANLNKGMKYYFSIDHITCYLDYVDDIHDKFSHINKEDIAKILRYGWIMFNYFITHLNADIALKSNKTTDLFYCGMLVRRERIGIHYKMLTRKHRFRYVRAKKKYNGYYYFGMTQEQYDNAFTSKTYKGLGRMQYLRMNEIDYRKILNELFVPKYDYVFKVRIPYDCGWQFKEYNVKRKMSDIELMYARGEDKEFQRVINYNLLRKNG